MKISIVSVSIAIFSANAFAAPFHDSIPVAFQGTWAPTATDCSDPVGVNQFHIDSDSVNYYEANDYLLIGVEFWGAMTRGSGSGAIFNGRFTSRSESRLLNENNIRMEIDDTHPDVLLRYPIGDDGEPVSKNQVRSVRCKAIP